MGAKSNVVSAAEKIDAALQKFVSNCTEAKVSVFADKWGKLQAVVVTHDFDAMPPDERKKRIWEFLRQQVAADDLAPLFRVYAFTVGEYDARIAPGIASGELGLFVRGAESFGDDHG